MLRSNLLIIAVLPLFACSSGSNSPDNDTLPIAEHQKESVNQDEAAGLPPYSPQNIPGMARIENKSYVLSSALWANRNIPVCWENESNANDRDRVKSAVTAAWQANSTIKFFGWGSCGANAQGIRIRVSDVGPHTKGLGNQLNAKPQGMVLNFTFKNWSPTCASSEDQRQSCVRSIAVHEFGHALGFAHEQNRPDTPGECQKKPQGSDGDLMLTPWDPSSVMNYCNSTYNNDGKLSDLDIATMKKIYS